MLRCESEDVADEGFDQTAAVPVHVDAGLPGCRRSAEVEVVVVGSPVAEVRSIITRSCRCRSRSWLVRLDLLLLLRCRRRYRQLMGRQRKMILRHADGH